MVGEDRSPISRQGNSKSCSLCDRLLIFLLNAFKNDVVQTSFCGYVDFPFSKTEVFSRRFCLFGGMIRP
jgi:hypothetical protein